VSVGSADCILYIYTECVQPEGERRSDSRILTNFYSRSQKVKKRNAVLNYKSFKTFYISLDN